MKLFSRRSVLAAAPVLALAALPPLGRSAPSKPMPLGTGKFIQPTGKTFYLPMCTVGHWKSGVMFEEFLYWDNATYMRQIGVGG